MLALFVDQLIGVMPHQVDGELSILQMLMTPSCFLEHNLEQAHNMKLILCAFEQLLGLKINFHKSEIFLFGEAKDDKKSKISIWTCLDAI